MKYVAVSHHPGPETQILPFTLPFCIQVSIYVASSNHNLQIYSYWLLLDPLVDFVINLLSGF